MESPGPASKVNLHVPWGTLVKMTVFALVVIALYKLFSLIMLCFLALLLAVALEPVLHRFERRMPRSLALGLVFLMVAFLLSILFFLILPPFYEQLSRIIQKAPKAGASFMTHLPSSGLARHLVEKILEFRIPDFESWVPRLLDFGHFAVEGITSLVLVFALMAYLLVDGKKTWSWIVAFFPSTTQEKMRKTAEEVTPVISAFVVGQLATCFFCFLFVYVALKALGVPAALVLAVLAGILDIFPIVGLFISVVPAILFGMTVSLNVALVVFAVYCLYHALESYLLAPWVYGHRLRVSGLVVLLGILVGVALFGLLGAVIALPIAASYHIVERIWFSERLGSQVISQHQTLDNAP